MNNFLNRFKAAYNAFKNTPLIGRVTAQTTRNYLPTYKQPAVLSAQARKQISQNPYVYSALRNTADDLCGKWNGAAGYMAQSDKEAHLERPAQIHAASALPLHESQAEHLRWVIDHRVKRGWDEVIRQLLRARKHGKSVQEIIWAYQPNGPWADTWVIDDVIDCDPDCFSFQYLRQKNELTGEVTYQRRLLYDPNGSGCGGYVCPDNKFLVFSFDKEHENEDGESILTKLDLFDWFQRNNFNFWMVDLNRYGSPMIVGSVPKTAGDAQRQALLDAIDSVQQETGIVISEDEKVELLQAQRNGASGFELLHNIINHLITVVITGNALSLEGGDRTGSYALAKATTAEIREILLYALATMIDSVINRQLIPWFMRFNYPGTLEFPRQEILPPRARDIATVDSEGDPLSSLLGGALTLTEQEPQAPETSGYVAFAADSVADKLINTSIERSLPIFEDTWITPMVGMLRDSDPNAFSTAEDLFKDFEPDLSDYQDLLFRAILTANILGRWQTAKAVKPQQFASVNDLTTPMLLDKASDILLSKKLMSKRQFELLVDQLKRQTFTIAGQEDERIQGYVRQEIAAALTDGVLENRELAVIADKAFRKYGVTEQTPYHAATVFRTNIQSAINDAQWQMMHDPEILAEVAYLEYVTMEDTRVRPNHRKMHGVIRPVDDPVWKKWYPPNGYNCRCKLRVITRAEAQRRNLKPTPILPPVLPDDGFISGPTQAAI